MTTGQNTPADVKCILKKHNMESFEVLVESGLDCKKTKRIKYRFLKSLPTRRKARQWCRNHYFENGWRIMKIKHPNGKEEFYERKI